MKSLQISIGKISLHYEQYGEQGQKILMLHGWGCSITHFEPIAKELSKDYQITVLDLPAHGASDRPPEPWGVPEYAACVKQFMETLRLSPCDIIAHSFGGRLALYIAATWPEMVHRLVLTGCAGLKAQPTAEQQKRSQEFQRKKQLLQGLKKLPFLEKPLESAEEKLRQQYGSADYNALDAEMRKTFVKIISQDLRPLLPAIQAPTLLIWGEKDTATPLWMGQTMEKEIPDAGLVLFENDDHYAYLRQWPRFVAIVRAFLT